GSSPRSASSSRGASRTSSAARPRARRPEGDSMADRPRLPPRPGFYRGRVVEVQAQPVSEPRPAVPPDPGSNPEVARAPKSARTPTLPSPVPADGRGGADRRSPQSAYARALVSALDRPLGHLLSHGGRSVAIILSFALLAYVSPPALTAAGEQLVATITAYRQPDMARELARAIDRIDRLADSVKSDADRAERARVSVELMASEVIQRADQGRDDDRAALQVAFQQIDQLADVLGRAPLPIVLHDSWPTNIITTEAP